MVKKQNEEMFKKNMKSFCLDKTEFSSQTGTKRAAWCIFGKQSQNVETLLFKGKFYDWPGDLKELKPVNDAANNVNRIPSARRVWILSLIFYNKKRFL